MSNGILFYWFGWVLWIVVTFIMKKGSRRTFYASWLLVMLACSTISFTINDFRIGMTFVILLLGLIYFHSIAKSLYLLFSAFTISLGYLAILFWERITPIWFFLPRSILIPLVITLLVVMLTKNFHAKLSVGLLGITSGEIIYSIILSSYQLQNTIGDLAFFDILFMLVILVSFLEIIQKGRVKLYSLVHTYKHSLGWKVNGH